GRVHCQHRTHHGRHLRVSSTTQEARLETVRLPLATPHSRYSPDSPTRLAYDAAMTKANKQFKKEKEQKEAEQELATAKERYDEVSADVQARMISIQENEVQQWHDLTALLDVQVKFAKDYLTIMEDLKSQWIAESNIKRLPPSRPRSGPHSFPSRSN